MSRDGKVAGRVVGLAQRQLAVSDDQLAEALDVSSHTIRSWRHRGVDRVRALALAGYAWSVGRTDVAVQCVAVADEAGADLPAGGSDG